MTTLGMVYSRSEVYQDLKNTYSTLFSRRPSQGLVYLKATVQKIKDKIFCNFREFIVTSYFKPCKCFTKKVCVFHGDGHPFFRDFYDKRDEPSEFWVIKRAIICQFYHSLEEIKNHPRKSTIAIAFTIYSMVLFPNITSAIGLCYLAGELCFRIYAIFD